MRIHTFTEYELTDDPYDYILVADESHLYDGDIAMADRSAQGAASGAAKDASATGSNYGGAGAGIASTLIPTLKTEANNPIGYTPTEMNNQLVAGEQGAGGATAGITGQAGLNAMRTRNTGNLSTVLDQAARTKQQALSGNALNVANKSADLGEQKQMEAQKEFAGLYGTDVNAQLKAMGLVAPDVNAETNAGKSGWLQDTEGLLGTLGGLGLGSAKAAGLG